MSEKLPRRIVRTWLNSIKTFAVAPTIYNLMLGVGSPHIGLFAVIRGGSRSTIYFFLHTIVVIIDNLQVVLLQMVY